MEKINGHFRYDYEPDLRHNFKVNDVILYRVKFIDGFEEFISVVKHINVDKWGVNSHVLSDIYFNTSEEMVDVCIPLNNGNRNYDDFSITEIFYNTKLTNIEEIFNEFLKKYPEYLV